MTAANMLVASAALVHNPLLNADSAFVSATWSDLVLLQ